MSSVGDEAGTVTETAPAKVNLYLHVTGRRTDGYHLLDSLVVFAGDGDRVQVVPADDLRLDVAGPFAGEVPGGDDNLVLRAARLLAEAAGLRCGAAIRLEKRLPVAAGIGGGSADGAATLRALVRLWGVDVDAPTLARLALRLGADVPMCLSGRPAFVGGIGEEIEPVPGLPPFALLLVNPRVPLPTPRVFAGRSGPFSPPARFGEPVADARALAALLMERRNDLSPPAIGLVPEVERVLAVLAATPGVRLARMSGSGATCFGLLDDAAAAETAARTLAAARPDWWVEAASVAGEPTSD
jgi:4-diphosphocytidyl-2-C-methyl-D-erythritol kinase